MQTDSIEPRLRSRWMRWPNLLAAACALILAAVFISRFLAAQKLTEEYRLIREGNEPVLASDLNDWHGPPSPHANRAFAILDAADAISTNLPRVNAFERVGRLEPLPDGMKQSLAEFVANNADALEIARAIGTFQQSRYSVDWSAGPATLVPHLSKAKSVVQLLRFEALLKMETGQCAEAIQSILGCFHVAESLSSEPILISQLVRNACLHLATQSAERLLSSCALTDDQLTALEDAVVEATHQGRLAMQRALIGERSIGNHCFALPLAKSVQLYPSDNPPPDAAIRIMETLTRATGLRDWDHLFYARTMKKWIRAAGLEFPEGLQEAKRVDDELRINFSENRLYYISRMLLPAVQRAIEKSAENTAQLHLARAAISIERFRLRHGGKVPASLDDLKPQFLKLIPEDPFDGKPVRFAPGRKGYTVYSIGRDRSDQGGTEPPKTKRTGVLYDLTFSVTR